MATLEELQLASLLRNLEKNHLLSKLTQKGV